MRAMKKTRRWTEEELAGIKKPRGKGRYGNVKKITEDGIRFDSKREYLRYLDLKLLQRAGEIQDLMVHPKYPIVIGGIPIMVALNQHKPWGRLLTYEADFTYLERVPGTKHNEHRQIIEDVKMQSGHRTGVYKLKRALMKAMGHEIKEY
jgi:hypothetical protein